MSFRKTIIEAVLNESPMKSEVDREDVRGFVSYALQSAIQNKVSHKLSGEHHIVTSSSGIQVHFHKQNGVPPRSISVFQPQKEGMVHSYAYKGNGSQEEILKNLYEARKQHNKIWSDDNQTDGAINLWKSLSQKYPKRVHVMKKNSYGEFENHGLLKDTKDEEVWGLGKNHQNTRLLFN